MGPARRSAAVFLLGLSRFLDTAAADAGSDLDAALAVSRARARAVERVTASTVLVRAFREPREGEGRVRYGAGIVVRSDGLVLTCLHVVAGADAVVVVLGEGAAAPARVAARDEAADVALLAAEWGDRRPPAATFGDDRALAVGEAVVALGNPLGVGLSASAGICTAKGRRGLVPGQPGGLLQTDTSTHPGCSGGPLFDLRGEVVGLVTAALEPGAGERSVAFALPASEIQRVLPDLLAGRAVRRPWLGIQVRGREGDGGGVEIETVVPGGPCARAGAEAGDVLVALDGRGIADLEALRGTLRDLRPGDRASLRVLRGDRFEALDVVLGERRPAGEPAPR